MEKRKTGSTEGNPRTRDGGYGGSSRTGGGRDHRGGAGVHGKAGVDGESRSGGTYTTQNSTVQRPSGNSWAASCAICGSADHRSQECEEISKFTEEELRKKEVCLKCLNRRNSKNHKERGGCHPVALKFICSNHNKHHLLCGCTNRSTQNRTEVFLKSANEFNNNCLQNKKGVVPTKRVENNKIPKGSFFKKPVILMSENVTLVAPDGTEMAVVLNYDTWASHSSINQSLEKFITDLNFEGDLLIQQFGNVIPQEETYTGVVRLKQKNKKL